MCAYCYMCLCGTVFVGLYMCVVLYICVVFVTLYVCGGLCICVALCVCVCGVFLWHYICVHGVKHVALQCVQCFCAMFCIRVDILCFCVALHVCVVLCILCSITCVWCYVSVCVELWSGLFKT